MQTPMIMWWKWLKPSTTAQAIRLRVLRIKILFSFYFSFALFNSKIALSLPILRSPPVLYPSVIHCRCPKPWQLCTDKLSSLNISAVCCNQLLFRLFSDVVAGFPLPIKSAYYLPVHQHDSQSELNHLKSFFLYLFPILWCARLAIGIFTIHQCRVQVLIVIFAFSAKAKSMVIAVQVCYSLVIFLWKSIGKSGTRLREVGCEIIRFATYHRYR